MQDWKLTIAEGIVSYSKSGKKDVKIVTKSNKVGALVAQAIQTGIKSGNPPLSTDFKGITKSNHKQWNWMYLGALIDPLAAASTIGATQAIGQGWKTFYVRTGSWQAQEEFIDRLGKVIQEVNTYKNTAADPTPVAPDDPKGNDEQKNSYLWIGAAIIAVILIVWALRKK